MTVQEMINRLQEVKNKAQIITIYDIKNMEGSWNVGQIVEFSDEVRIHPNIVKDKPFKA